MDHKNFLETKDLADLQPKDIDSLAEYYGNDFHKEIKTAQIRNIFSSIQAIRTKFRIEGKVSDELIRELILLKPKVAYAKGRNKKREFETLYYMMKNAIDKTVESKQKDLALKNFIALMESIVAYHKFFGGRDN